jgi:hypothetical protein
MNAKSRRTRSSEKTLRRAIWNVVTFGIGAEPLIVQGVEAFVRWDLSWAHFLFTTADGWFYFIFVSGSAILHALQRSRQLASIRILYLLAFILISFCGTTAYALILEHADFAVAHPFPYQAVGVVSAFALYLFTQRYLDSYDNQDDADDELPPV